MYHLHLLDNGKFIRKSSNDCIIVKEAKIPQFVQRSGYGVKLLQLNGAAQSGTSKGMDKIMKLLTKLPLVKL